MEKKERYTSPCFGSPVCQCEERQKPILQRAWFVIGKTPSKYIVRCDKCHWVWKTRAKYTLMLKYKSF